jgi:hypothetical protein
MHRPAPTGAQVCLAVDELSWCLTAQEREERTRNALMSKSSLWSHHALQSIQGCPSLRLAQTDVEVRRNASANEVRQER